MSYLKKAGMLEKNINLSLEKLSSQFQSEAIKELIKQRRHIDTITKNLMKPRKEIEKSIWSYEKLIIEHKDKIANPSKHYSDWNDLDTKRRIALLNKKWPIEIKGYEEQQKILQIILKERFAHEWSKIQKIYL